MWRRLESDSFVAQERAQRAWILRYGVLLALAALLGTTLQNIAYFDPAASVLYIQWGIALALNLVVVFWWAGSAHFAKRPIIDLALALPIIVWMEAIRIVMTTQSGITGWAPAATITANYTLGVAFASLFFPANVRSYIAWVVVHAILFAWALFRTGSPAIETGFGWGVYVPVARNGIYSSWAIDRKGRANFELAQSLAYEKIKSDEMLFSILPEEVAALLRAGQAVADSFSDATIVFVDLIGSSQLARNLPPRHFLSMLNDVFSIADRGAALFGVEKVKTIGDAYLAVAAAEQVGTHMHRCRSPSLLSNRWKRWPEKESWSSGLEWASILVRSSAASSGGPGRRTITGATR